MTGARYCFRLADHDDWSKWFAILYINSLRPSVTTGRREK
jgi:hypothetical protein